MDGPKVVMISVRPSPTWSIFKYELVIVYENGIIRSEKIASNEQLTMIRQGEDGDFAVEREMMGGC